MSILPYVIKDLNYKNLDFTKEKELRMWIGFEEINHILGDRIYPNIKQNKKYSGIQKTLEECNLRLSGICIGRECDSNYRIGIEKYAKINNIKLYSYESII